MLFLVFSGNSFEIHFHYSTSELIAVSHFPNDNNYEEDIFYDHIDG